MKTIQSHLRMAVFLLMVFPFAALVHSISGAAEPDPLRQGAAKIVEASLQPAEWAVIHSLRQMGFQLKELKGNEEGRVLRAEGEDREVEIQLEGLAGGRTLIRAAVFRYFFMDREAAARIVDRAEWLLDSNFKRGA